MPHQAHIQLCVIFTTEMNMRQYITIFLALLGAVILFHLTILFRIIPYDIAWGGRLQTDQEMYVFEAISIIINIFLVFVLLMKGALIQYRFQDRTLNIILWVFFSLFILNTIGNLFAKTAFEKLFAVMTLFFAFLIWKIIMTRKSNDVRGDGRIQ